MLFTSLQFAAFLPIAFLLYWFVFQRSLRWQNVFLLVASYVFYGWWNPRFLLLIAFTTLCSYFCGLKKGKVWLWVNVVANLAVLGIFKYYDFFASELAQLLHIDSDPLMLHLVLPVGISFYTFQAIGYTIDVHKGRIAAERNPVTFAAFISFFPQLVAGPIERAQHLLPQIQQRRTFSYDEAVDGARLILWGLFKKMVVADNCARYVDSVFILGVSPSARVLAAVFFAFQIYGDFSGYSDIAIGIAKLFGIQLMENFRRPYFSRDIAEFWRRWHISLTTWFRDYVYIPLGGSRCSKAKVVRNTFVIFLLSGFWHGANWTFLLWGFYHACLFLPLILLGHNRRHVGVVAEGRLLPSPREALQMLLTFILATLGWVIFRATGIPSLVGYLRAMFSWEAWRALYLGFTEINTLVPLCGILLLLAAEWFTREQSHPLASIHRIVRPAWLRAVLWGAALVLCLYLRGDVQQFIYFQF